jgi:hypothetical protein
MKLSAIKAEGYEGMLAHCEQCRKLVEIPFSKLPDGEWAEVAAKLICETCGKRPNVTSYRPQTESMIAKGLK